MHKYSFDAKLQKCEAGWETSSDDPLTWRHVENSFGVLIELQANCSFNAEVKRYRNHNVFIWTNSKTFSFFFVIVQLVRWAECARSPPPHPSEAKTNWKESSWFSVQHKFSQIPTWRKVTKRDVQCCSMEWGMQKRKKKGDTAVRTYTCPCSENTTWLSPLRLVTAHMWPLSVMICLRAHT